MPVLFEEMTREQIKAIAPNAIAVMPTAATEQHGPHMAVGTDTLLVSTVAARAAESAADSVPVVVTPPLAFGSSHHHIPFGGTLSLTSDTFIDVVREVTVGLVKTGFCKIAILNGHGGNVKPMMRRIDEYKDKLGINLRFQSYWDVYDPALVQQHMEHGRLPGHADEFETSTMLYLAPERVQAEAIDNESAALGTREKGEALVGPAVDGVAGLLRQMIAGEDINLPTVTFYPEGKRDLVSGDPI